MVANLFSLCTQLIKSVMSWRSFHLQVPCICWFHYWFSWGDLTTGLFIGGSLQLFVWCWYLSVLLVSTQLLVGSCDCLLSFTRNWSLAITTIAVPVAALWLSSTFLVGDNYILRTPYWCCDRTLWLKRNRTNYLLGAVPWAFLMPFQSSLPCLWWWLVQTVVDLLKIQWVADGLTRRSYASRSWFAILLRYLPVKRNLHYLAMGFGLTAMLTVLYSNVTGLGGCSCWYHWNSS